MLVLALLVIPVIVIQASDLGEPWDTIAYALDWLIWVGFAAELVFVLTVAPHKRRALRAHWLDATIVIVSFPQLPALLASARLIRLVRLARLARLGLFGARAMQSARLVTTRQGFRFVALSVVVTVIVAGAAITLVNEKEFPSVWDGIWWAITTVTTVGYGDYAPTDTSGRIVAIILMFVGIGFLGVLTATIASRFVEVDTAEAEQKAEEERVDIADAVHGIDERLSRLEEQLAEVLRRI